MKKKLVYIVAIPVLAVIGLVIFLGLRGGKLEAYYVYNNPCETCREYEKFAETFQNALGSEAARCKLNRVYLLADDGRAEFDALCEKLGIPEGDRIAPMLIIGNQYMLGMDNIDRNCRALYDAARRGAKYSPGAAGGSASAGTTARAAAAAPDESYLMYFTAELCGACKETSEYLATMPGECDVSGKNGAIRSKIVLDTRPTADAANMELLAKLYEKFGVPDDERTVPVVFYAAGYLRGTDAIKASLMDEIRAGDALGFAGP